MTAIVLDGNQRSALTVVRSLGKRGISVVVGDEAPRSLSSVSRYCRKSFVYPSPIVDPEKFLEVIADRARDYPDAVLLPMTDVTLSEVLKNRETLSKYVRIPFPGLATYQAVSDKVALFRTASGLDVPVPKTFYSDDYSTVYDLVSECAMLSFPLVLKPAFSRVKRDGKWLSTNVRYARDLQEFRALVMDEPFRSLSFLVQEKIQGPGLGIFLFMDKGEIIARFAHQRIREKPPSGGVSVLCQSITPPHEALEAGRKLLEHYQWTGVAMVEFKWDSRLGQPKLMEINGRFWGSLQLAVTAGVDFPFLLYSYAMGEQLPLQKDYKSGIRSRWELGDLDHLLIRFRRRNDALQLPPDAPGRRQLLKEFIWDFFRPSVHREIFRLDDPKPFVAELRQYFRNLRG
jgi:predicted ATP-grasp superfamily ATP-dependent carboligase